MLKARLFSMFGIDDFPTEDLDLQVNIISIFTDEKTLDANNCGSVIERTVFAVCIDHRGCTLHYVKCR